MKKALYVALVAMFLVTGLASVSMAAVGNGEWKASLLVWPKIVVDDDPAQDTVITMFNDTSRSTYVHCYWMDEEQYPADFEFEITRYQTVWFRASDGGGMGAVPFARYPVSVPGFNGNLGELKCWAINGDDEGPNFDLPIKRNHLIGNATIYNFEEGTAIGYNAYGFRKISDGLAADAELILDGEEYDACPSYLLGTFMLAGASFEDQGYLVSAGTTELTIVPCKQDLRQDRVPIYAKANLIVYDEDEVSFTNTYICFKCWVETTLDDPPITSLGATKTNLFVNFTQAQVGGVYATVKVQPTFGNAGLCKFPTGVNAPAVPFIGLLFGSQTITPLDPAVPAEPPLWATSGGLMHHTSTQSAIDGVSILYDRLLESEESSNR